RTLRLLILRLAVRGLGVLEQAKWVVGGEPEAVALEAAFRHAVARPRVDADEPGRTVSDDIVLLMLGDLLVGHAGKIIVRLVVLPHMLEAEAVIFTLVPTALRRGVKTRLREALPVAGGAVVFEQAILVGFDAQPVEEFRVELHAEIMGSAIAEG